MRVVLDTNILVRANPKASPQGLACDLLLTIASGPHVLILSPAILIEIRRVLTYPHVQARWPLTAETIEQYLASLEAVGVLIELPSVSPSVVSDPDDDPILQTAILGYADVLCTRDVAFQHEAVQKVCASHNLKILDDITLMQRTPPPNRIAPVRRGADTRVCGQTRLDAPPLNSPKASPPHRSPKTAPAPAPTPTSTRPSPTTACAALKIPAPPILHPAAEREPETAPTPLPEAVEAEATQPATPPVPPPRLLECRTSPQSPSYRSPPDPAAAPTHSSAIVTPRASNTSFVIETTRKSAEGARRRSSTASDYPAPDPVPRNSQPAPTATSPRLFPPSADTPEPPASLRGFSV